MGSIIRKSCSSGLPQVERARLRDRGRVRLRMPCDTNLVIEPSCTSTPSRAEVSLGGGGGVDSASIQSASANFSRPSPPQRNVRFWHLADINPDAECPLFGEKRTLTICPSSVCS